MVIKKAKQSTGNYFSRIKEFTPNARMFLTYVFLISLNLGVYKVIFNLYILRLGYSEDFLGMILSLTSIATGVFSIPAAMICDRIGRKRTLLLSCLLLTISLVFLYNTTVKELLMFFSILYGASSALNIVTGSTFMLENSKPYERMHLFSMYQLFYTAATMAGNLVGGAFPAMLAKVTEMDASGSLAYRITLMLSLVTIMVSFLPLLKIKEEKAVVHQKRRSYIFSSLLRSENVLKMIIVYTFFGLGWGLALPYFNVYLDVILNAGSDEIGIVFSLAEILMMIALLFLPAFTECFGKIRVASMVQILSIPFLMLFISTPILPLVGFAYVMRSTLMNLANPILNNFKLEIVSEEERATMNSIAWMTCYVFVGVGTYAGGYILASGNYRLPFIITCGMYAAAAILNYVFFDKFERNMAST
ncbi:arabinose efflux permease family protein [Methanolobus tindarius DSM 2278]|uniref:Arabinose efflux permease family protein n=1 Tax=Methanolobus tindarius DSM 2278 TaxID=1090322 RepID=W9DU69_METTI|nr:MFS transporter [Methanolobus tindarius]ETA67217.1 arabinose efflux permease family protein [Methanolobus tindarius DSM 2278]